MYFTCKSLTVEYTQLSISSQYSLSNLDFGLDSLFFRKKKISHVKYYKF